MSDTPPLAGGAAERIARAQELSAVRVRNGKLTIRLAQLESQLAGQKVRNERSVTIRFAIMCLIALAGLGALLYLQIDSRGSGQLRTALIKQCETRNANVIVTKQGLEQQALNNDKAGQSDYAEVWRTLSNTLATVDCTTLR
jgi:hypothetical protein